MDNALKLGKPKNVTLGDSILFEYTIGIEVDYSYGLRNILKYLVRLLDMGKYISISNKTFIYSTWTIIF